MADKRISELPIATALQGSEEFVFVQGNESRRVSLNEIDNRVIGHDLTVSADTTINLNDSQYSDWKLIRLQWSGASGTMTLNLPQASENRAIRIITDRTFETNTRVNLTPSVNNELDGSTDVYEINKAYEGIYIWSSGDEWFIIQKKA
jgi:hypothetical protein